MKATAALKAPSFTDETLAGHAEFILLSTDGADFRGVGVDSVEGVITLCGKVRTESEKREAAAALRNLEGVLRVDNYLEVAPEALRPTQ
jgi:osmotically-inducible protein OsmY